MGGGLKRSDSKILLALGKKDDNEKSQFKPLKSERDIPAANNRVNEADQKRGFHRVSSQVNFGQAEVQQNAG